MTYAPGTWSGVSLNALFAQFKNMGDSGYGALGRIDELLQHGNVEVTPKLPPVWRLVLHDDAGVAISTSDKTFDGSAIFVRARGSGLSIDPDGSLAQQLAREAAAVAEAALRTIAQAINLTKEAEAGKPPSAAKNVKPQNTVTKEEQAIAWLSTRLNSQESVKRDEFQMECMQNFGLSARRYLTYVWPEARKQAGLSPLGRSGRKKKSPS